LRLGHDELVTNFADLRRRGAAAEAPTTIGASVIAANSANALELTRLTPNLIASMIGPRGMSSEIAQLAALCILLKQF
jgi:hypothetical protein